MLPENWFVKIYKDTVLIAFDHGYYPSCLGALFHSHLDIVSKTPTFLQPLGNQ